jgi:DNA-3-methyladenine glycosylase
MDFDLAGEQTRRPSEPSPAEIAIPRSFYSRHPVPVARDLLGKLLVRRTHDRLLGGIITDTEAYGPPCEDPLVRMEGRRGLRQDWEAGLAWTTYTMRGRPTLNITTHPPSCVLIRAIEPTIGFYETSTRELGPINLAKALAIDRALDKIDVTVNGPLLVCQGELISSDLIVESERKNVRVDTHEPRRFRIRKSQLIPSGRCDD